MSSASVAAASASGPQSAAPPAASAAPAHSSGSSAIATVAKEHKLGTAAVAAIVLVLLAGTAYAVRTLFTHTAAKPFAQFSITQATNAGTATLATISPDGKYLLFTKSENGLESLWLRNIPTSSDTQVVAPSQNPFASLSFSLDGNYLYFRQAGDKTGLYHLLFRAPVLGGAPKLLARDVDAHPAFSPDGQRMVYIRCNNPEANKCRWLSAAPDGSNEQLLLVRPFPIPAGLSWSADGRFIAFVFAAATAQDRTRVLLFDVEKNQELQLVPSRTNALLKFDGLQMAAAWSFCMATKARTMSEARSATSLTPLENSSRSPTTPITTTRLLSPTMAVPLAPSKLRTLWNRILSRLRVARPRLHSRNLQGASTGPGGGWLSDSDVLLVLPSRLLRVSLDGSQQTEIFGDTNASLGPAAICDSGHTIVVTISGHDNDNSGRLWRMDADGSNLKRLTSAKTSSCPGALRLESGLLHRQRRIALDAGISGGGKRRRANQASRPVGVGCLPNQQCVAR